MRDSSSGLAEGKRRRDEALDLLSQYRPVLIRRVQRAFLDLLLTRGPSTIDPVRALVPIPSGISPKLVGPAVRALVKLKLVRRTGLSRSTRPEAHCRDLPVWAIADRPAARAWLAANPNLPEPDQGEPVQRTLFDL
jgi:hypothetical protein